ncbi:MAG: MarR family winged helix-turn-helix transcriptional regulator [Gemmatimonadota bacterium]
MSQASLLLERLGALIQQSVRDDAARHGLLPIHIQVLHYLARANHYSDLPIAIAEYFGLTRGTVSQTLAVLERKGLLTKEPDARHGKRVHLRLTSAGESILNESWAERVEQALGGHAIEAAALEGTLRNLLSALQHMNGQRAFGICQQCAHFLTEENGARCGLTGEALATEQTARICREWTALKAECV